VNQAAELDALEQETVNHLFTLSPGLAVALGLHVYDGRLPDLSRAATDRWAVAADRLLERLRGISPDALSEDRRYDRTLLELSLESSLFDLRESRDYDQNPMVYVGGLSLTPYLVRPYAPLATRLQAVQQHLAAVPAFLRSGRERLDPAVAAPFLQLAIGMGEGLLTEYSEAEPIARSAGEQWVEALRTVREPADAAIREFVDALRREWQPRATQAFALGPERYQRLLWVREGIRAPYADLLSAGKADLKRNQARLDAIARSAEPPTDARGLLARAAQTHPTAAGLVGRARDFVDETKLFVREKELVTIPEPAICRVEETPNYHRALSTASMNAPGAFDTAGEEGLYFVTPADPAWPPATQEDWLRSFNDAVLRNVTVHEVYPGHYLHFLHLRRSAGSLARKTYLSGAFTEGWAHYAEQLAVEQGLGSRSPETEAAQLYDALLRNCRLIVSVGLHAQGMTVDEATAVFEREGYCAPIVAQREAIRGTFDPAYFGYTLGKLAILEARKTHLGPRFGGSLRAFHDRLLGFGAPPVGFLDELLRHS
jgi:uncharacterized protein (DUF885 family)